MLHSRGEVWRPRVCLPPDAYILLLQVLVTATALLLVDAIQHTLPAALALALALAGWAFGARGRASG